MKSCFLFKEIERIRHSDFVRDSTTLLTANALSQAIAIIVYPVITRLYSPQDVGLYSLFLSISSVASIFVTGRYEPAIVLPKENGKAAALFQLTLIISVCCVMLLLPVCIVFRTPIAQVFNEPSLAVFLPLLPALIFVTGIWQSLNYLLIREKRFNNISGYNLGQSIMNSGAKCLFGFKHLLDGGLIYATLLGQFVALSGSLVAFRKKIREFLKFDRLEIRSVAKEYTVFPKFELPHAVVNTLAGNLPIFILSAYFGMAEIGFFSLGITLGFRPISLFSSSMEQVLYKKVTENFQQKQPIKPFLNEFCKKIAFVILPCFIILYFTVEGLCAWLFGPTWRTAGFYTKLMLPWFFFVLLTGSLSFLPKLFFKQKMAMLIEFFYIFVRIIALSIGVFLKDFTMAVVLFSVVSASVIALQLVWYFSLVNRYERTR